MAKSFRTLVLDALKAGDGFKSALEALKARANTMSLHDYSTQLATIIGKVMGAEPHESRKGGALTFTKGCAAEQRLTRLRKLHNDYGIAGGVQNHKPEPKAKVRGTVVATAAREARAAVVAAGMTRAEFNAFIQALRESVSFK